MVHHEAAHSAMFPVALQLRTLERAGEQATQHFALITRGDKLFAVPVEWFYVFKPARKTKQNVEQAEAMRKAAADQEAKMTRAFNARFRIKEDESALVFSSWMQPSW
jgi:hypothetical protein